MLDKTFYNLLNLASFEAIIAYCFLLIILLTFFKYVFFSGDIERKGVQKIIGGLGVFEIAIISQNDWVFFTSLFIGGLIIASEEFMKALAAILRSRNDKVSEVLAKLNYEKASEKEVEEKQVEEAKEDISKAVIIKNTKSEENSTETAKSIEIDKAEVIKRQRSIRFFEESVLNHYAEQYSSYFEKRIRVTSDIDNRFIFDGILKDSEGRIKYIIEVKYIPEHRHGSFFQESVLKAIAYIRLMFPDFPIILALVFDGEEYAKEFHTFFLSRIKKVRVDTFYIRDNKAVLVDRRF